MWVSRFSAVGKGWGVPAIEWCERLLRVNSRSRASRVRAATCGITKCDPGGRDLILWPHRHLRISIGAAQSQLDEALRWLRAGGSAEP